MAKQPPEPQSANLQPDQMRAALPRLRSRLEELRAVKIDDVQKRGEPSLVAMEQKVNSTLSDILGPGSVEYKQFGDVLFDRAGWNSYRPTPLNEVRR